MSPTYSSWASMRQRCKDLKRETAHRYVGRGISVCERWANSFEAFLEDMGPRPTGKTLDRINNDLGYSPDNCRWATSTEQHSNKTQRTAKPIDTPNGPMTLAQIRAFLGISEATEWRWSREKLMAGVRLRMSDPTIQFKSGYKKREGGRQLTVNGKTQNIEAWASEYRLPGNLVVLRLHRGWTLEEALTTPKAHTANKRYRLVPET